MPDLPEDFYSQVFLASTELLLELERGIIPFRVDDQGVSPVYYEGDGTPYIFYEVAAFGEGSWWTPISSEPSTQWQGAEPLEAEGDIVSTAMFRPRRLLWWIPAEALEPDISTLFVFGQILGDWPSAPPPEPQPRLSRKRKRED